MRPHPGWSAAVVLAVAVAAWIAFRATTGIVLEDALITFRFAENLARGRGFAFHPGEPVYGTTTPLLTLLLALLGRVFGPDRIPLLANAVLFACTAGAALLGARILARAGFGPGVGLMAIALFAFHPDTLWMTAGGMETPLVLLLMAASLERLLAERWRSAAVFASLLVLARPDGLVWAALVFAALAWRAPRRLAAALAVALLVQLPWLAFAMLEFGSVVPHSVVAKATVVGERPLLDLLRPTSLRHHLSWFADWTVMPPGGGLGPFEFAIALGLSALGAAAVLRSPRAWGAGVLAAFPFAFCAAYVLGRAPAGFPWYGVPVTWTLLLLAAVGLAGAWRRSRGSPAARAAVVAAVAWLAAGWSYEVVRTVRDERRFQVNETATRRRVGEWLAARVPAGGSVAMEAIGYQGVHSRRRVIDLAGLVSPAVVALRRDAPSNAAAYERVFRQLAPDAIVLRSFEVDEDRHRDGGRFFTGPAGRAWFLDTFEEAARFEAPHPDLWGGGARLTVYLRRTPVTPAPPPAVPRSP